MRTTKQEMQVLNFLLIHPQHFITHPWVCLSHGNHTDSVFCHHRWQHHSQVESPPFLISTLRHQLVSTDGVPLYTSTEPVSLPGTGGSVSEIRGPSDPEVSKLL